MAESITKKSIVEEARREVNQETIGELTGGYKQKLRELARAKLCVSNIEREMELLEAEMEELEAV